MDNAAQKLLEAATHRTLHASGFARSSSQAALVLSDILSRYIALLTSTCGKYAQHAGRTRLSPHDALNALDELGVDLEELNDFGSTEGIELNRYALQRTSRRVEDMHELRVRLSEGLKQDHDDVIPLHYARYEGDGEEDVEEEDRGISDEEAVPAETRVDDDDIYADGDVAMGGPGEPPRNLPPILPLSPISNPASPPSRKRQRLSDWQPPPHIPDFLPPFPTTEDVPTSPELPLEPVDHSEHNRPSSPVQHAPPAQALTSTAGADWLMQVPYHQSSLSSQSEFHLPTPLPVPPQRESKFPLPDPVQASIHAYHYLLTSKQPNSVTPGQGNPLRHKVAMSLLSLAQSSSRWEPTDTLYSNLTTNQPRVTAMGPSHPLPIDEKGLPIPAPKEKVSFPSFYQRNIVSPECLSNVLSQQSSRIPELAAHVLPTKIHQRTVRLGPPPPLIADGKPLTYGKGIPAPWNKGQTGSNDSGKKEEPRALPDAKLFATWDSDTKSFKEPLKATRGARGKAVVHSSRRTGRH